MSKPARHVLIVDDDDDTRLALTRLLEGEGFIVVSAADGPTALECAARSLPDLVITDLLMPEMDGLAFLAGLRARSLEMPVILATAVDDVARALAAIRAGAADYLTKPIAADALALAIERALLTRDLRRDAAALRASNEQLAAEAERNLRAREELLAMVAHDLRSPLSTILLSANTSSPPVDLQGALHNLQMIDRAAKRIASLVEDLLDVARIEAGGLVLDLAPHRASELLREAVGILEPAAAEAGVVLSVTLADDFVVQCAFERVVQVLVNLVSNALDVTARGRSTRLLAERRGELAWFAVEDDGPGIAPEHLSRVFERGWQATDRRRRHKGAGIGLTIAKGIVEAHGGCLSVESKVGEGSSFRFEMPLSGPERVSWDVTALARAAGAG